MNSQATHIVQAFAILLLFPIACGTINLISSSQNKEEINAVHIDYESTAQSFHPGQQVFQNKCMSCHNIFKEMVGPPLMNFEERGPWVDRKKLYEWIRNPSAFMAKNKYVRGLKEKYKVIMTAFPDMTTEEIDAVCDYINLESSIMFKNSPTSTTQLLSIIY